MSRKGLILAGGLGSRLHPSTLVVSKQLMPVYDKPMIYYPLTTLMLANIREIMIITTPQDSKLFKSLLGDGSQWGINLEYAIQKKPEGLAQAFLIAKDFISTHCSALILGDNIFYGHNFANILTRASDNRDYSTIFSYQVNDPENYGVANIDSNDRLISLEEKPLVPKSNLAVTGLYFYDTTVVDRVKDQKPSKRGELEITDLNNSYLDEQKLRMEKLQRGFIWMDTGTHDNLFDASQFIAVVERRQGQKIACPEEIALNLGWIDKNKMIEITNTYTNNSYKKYLLDLIQD